MSAIWSMLLLLAACAPSTMPVSLSVFTAKWQLGRAHWKESVELCGQRIPSYAPSTDVALEEMKKMNSKRKQSRKHEVAHHYELCMRRLHR